MRRAVEIGRVFTPVNRHFIDDGNLQTGQVALTVFLIEGVENHLVCLAGDGQVLGVVTEGNVSDGVRVVVQADVWTQRDRFVLLEQLLCPDPVEVVEVGVGRVPEPETAVRVTSDEELVLSCLTSGPIYSPRHRPLPAAPPRPLPAPVAEGGEGLEEVGRDVRQVVTAGHGALLQVHCIGVLEAGQAGRLAVNGHEVVSEENQDGLRVVLVTPPGRVSLGDEVHHAELHLQDRGVLALEDGHAGLGPRHVLGQTAAEYEAALSVPGDEPFHLQQTVRTTQPVTRALLPFLSGTKARYCHCPSLCGERLHWRASCQRA